MAIDHLYKSLPNSLEAEQMVLGCSILDNDVFEQAAHSLDPEMFFTPSNRKIFGAMCRLHLANRGIDPVTLQDELFKNADLDAIGGPAYIASLFDGVPRYSNIEDYVRMVREKFQLRKLISAGNVIMNRAMDEEMGVDEQLRLAEANLLEITARDTTGRWKHIGAVANSYLAEIEARAGSARSVVGFSTGFRDLDFHTLGLERKTVNVIAARPGMGKTGFALSLTENLSNSIQNRINANGQFAEDGEAPVIAWFSFEMPDDQLARRLIASRAGVDLRNLHLGRLDKDEWRRVVEAESWLATWRTHIDDRCGLSIPKMREALRQLRQDEKNVHVVFIDYLQLGDGEGGMKFNRAEEVARFSRGVTQMAKDYNVCIIALSQCNRLAETRSGNRIGLGDLRESGQIEQDAYMVWGLYRDEIYNKETSKPNVFEVDILKQRNGALTTVGLFFDGRQMRFRDLARGSESVPSSRFLGGGDDDE